MARVFVSFIALGSDGNNPLIPCFYESFLNALAEQGNEVLYAVSNEFIANAWEGNKTHWTLEKESLQQQVREFAPDIAICANNSIPDAIFDVLECPIAVWAVDAPVFFPNHERIRNHLDRYTFFSISESFDYALKKLCGVSPKRIHRLHFATDVRALPVKQDKNISFVGSNWQVAGNLRGTLLKLASYSDINAYMSRIAARLTREPSIHFPTLLEEENVPQDIRNHILTIPQTQWLNILASNQRLQTLANLTDLDLHIYGPVDWIGAINYSLPLTMSYHAEPIYSQDHTEQLYNSSVICPNISHAQAAGTFGWRVRDVMATNAVLISTPSADFKTTFGKSANIPIFESPAEARDICSRLLKDKAWRKDIVTSSQALIEKEHRFKHRIKDIAEAMKIQLINPTVTGSLKRLSANSHRHPVKYPAFKTSTMVLENTAVASAKLGYRIVKAIGMNPTPIISRITRLHRR